MKVADRCQHCQNECKLTVIERSTLEYCPEFKPRGNSRFTPWYREFGIPGSSEGGKMGIPEILEGIRNRGVRKTARLLGVNHSVVTKWLKSKRIPKSYVTKLGLNDF